MAPSAVETVTATPLPLRLSADTGAYKELAPTKYDADTEAGKKGHEAAKVSRSTHTYTYIHRHVLCTRAHTHTHTHTHAHTFTQLTWRPVSSLPAHVEPGAKVRSARAV